MADELLRVVADARPPGSSAGRASINDALTGGTEAATQRRASAALPGVSRARRGSGRRRSAGERRRSRSGAPRRCARGSSRRGRGRRSIEHPSITIESATVAPHDRQPRSTETSGPTMESSTTVSRTDHDRTADCCPDHLGAGRTPHGAARPSRPSSTSPSICAAAHARASCGSPPADPRACRCPSTIRSPSRRGRCARDRSATGSPR